MNSTKILTIIGFFALATIGVTLVLTILFLIPLLTFGVIGNWNFFWFFFVGSIILGLYYKVLFLLVEAITWLHKMGPNRWISATIISLSSIHAFYNGFIGAQRSYFEHGAVVPWTPRIILCLVVLTPAIIGIVFMFVVMPFLLNERKLREVELISRSSRDFS